MPPTRVRLLIAVLLLAGSVLACGTQEASGPRLVVLYASCTVNKSQLGPYTSSVDFTPNLDRFAEQAVVFRKHRTESGISGTSFASIFAGVQADRHGVFEHPRALPEDLHLIFEAFSAAGYDPWYWSGHAMSEPELGYAQGVADDHIERNLLSGTDPRLHVVLDRLREDPDYRALIVTSFSVTHTPWDLQHLGPFRKHHADAVGDMPPQRLDYYRRLFERNAFAFQSDFRGTAARLGLDDTELERLAAAIEVIYRSKVWLLDGLFGTVLDAIEARDLMDASLIAFTADHGQQLYNPDRLFQWTHGPDLAPEVIDVPLLIKAHGRSLSPTSIEQVTRSIDVYPTLAGLAGLAPLPETVDGVDLSDALRKGAPLPDLPAYSHGTLRRFKYFDPDTIDRIWASLRIGDRGYTWRNLDDRWELTIDDLDGTRRRVDPEDDRHRDAAASLWSYRERMIAAYRRQSPADAASKQEALERLDPEQAEALRALGYIE